MGAVSLEKDDSGIQLRVDGSEQTLAVDHIVVCAGQESRRELFDAVKATGQRVHLIGGADVAAELDAKRAISQGSRLASTF